MATNPYTTQTISNYNNSPPADDGSAVASNQLSWDKHKTKLADPVKTLAENINSQALAAFAKTINTDAGEANAIAGSLAFTRSELTISSGAVTPTRSFHTIDTESNTATDVLDTIATSGVSDNAVVLFRGEDVARVTTITHTDATSTATTNIVLKTGIDRDLNAYHPVMFVLDGAKWYEVADISDLAGVMTTAGDMLYLGTATDPSRLAIGTDGFVMLASGGVPVWASATKIATALGLADTAFTAIGTATGAIPLAGDTLQVGIHTVSLPANGWLPNTTNGASLADVETAVSAAQYKTLDYDPDTTQSACFVIPMPPSWDWGTFVADATWYTATVTTTATGDVVLGLSAFVVGEALDIDGTFGTEVTVTDSLGTEAGGQVGVFGAITPAGASVTATSTDIVLRLRRLATDAGDTLAGNASITSVRIYPAIEASTDD